MHGDPCRGLPLPVHMIFPRLFTCPTVTVRTFKVQFEVRAPYRAPLPRSGPHRRASYARRDIGVHCTCAWGAAPPPWARQRMQLGGALRLSHLVTWLASTPLPLRACVRVRVVR